MIENINYTSYGIPKIIHQVWINDTFLGNPKKDVPEKWKKSIELWKTYHQDWIHILWTDDMVLSYLSEYHPDMIEHYKNYEYLIQRADILSARQQHFDLEFLCAHSFVDEALDLDRPVHPRDQAERWLQVRRQRHEVQKHS